ncbi:hypothetical protein [Halovulum sp. GXIMD14793]
MAAMLDFWRRFFCCLLALVLTLLALRIYRKLPDQSALIFLILAPFGLLFFAYDPEGSYRKEVLGFLALAIALNGALASSRLRSGMLMFLASTTFLIGLLFHEGIIFLLPALLVAFALQAYLRDIPRRQTIILSALTMIGAALIFAIILATPAPDHHKLCEALEGITCGGAFSSLEQSLSDGIPYTFGRHTLFSYILFPAAAFLSFLPFIGVQFPGIPRRYLYLVMACLVLSILPLFIVAFDWGRWLQMIFFPASLIALTAIAAGVAKYNCPFPVWARILYVCSWCIPHAYPEIRFWGLIVIPTLVLCMLLRRVAHWARSRPLVR